MNGVENVTFDASKNEATITAKADATIDKDACNAAFKGMSFKAKKVTKKEA